MVFAASVHQRIIRTSEAVGRRLCEAYPKAAHNHSFVGQISQHNSNGLPETLLLIQTTPHNNGREPLLCYNGQVDGIWPFSFGCGKTSSADLQTRSSRGPQNSVEFLGNQEQVLDEPVRRWSMRDIPSSPIIWQGKRGSDCLFFAKKR